MSQPQAAFMASSPVSASRRSPARAAFVSAPFRRCQSGAIFSPKGNSYHGVAWMKRAYSAATAAP